MCLEGCFEEDDVNVDQGDEEGKEVGEEDYGCGGNEWVVVDVRLRFWGSVCWGDIKMFGGGCLGFFCI